MTKSIFKFLSYFIFFLLFTSTIYAQGKEREIIWSDYPYPISEESKERIQFGHIVVPETRNSENPRKLKIAFCIVKGSHENELDNPIIFLPGGPGGGMTQAAAYYTSPTDHWKERLEFTDIVFFDPRGCGKSEPDLCPAMDNPEIQYMGLMGKTEEEINQETIRILMQCSDSLSKEKVDTNAYGSDEVAQDIEDLRISLGIKQWNIQGASYGTRYGQGLIRNFPETVRTALLSGLVPTVRNYKDDALRSFSSSLQLILKDCMEDPNCDSNYPDLENQLFEGLEYYNKNPLVIAPEEQKLVKSNNIIINGEVIVQGIFQLSYGPVGIEIIPKVIQAVADKKDWVIKNFVNSIGDMFSGNSDMYLFINANDNPEYGEKMDMTAYDNFTKKLAPYFYSPISLSEREQALYLEIEQDSLQEFPIASDIPVILQTGVYDPITSPENTLITAEYLTNSITLSFPGHSHWARPNPCFSKSVTEFYRTGKIPADVEACMAESKPIQFVTNIAYNKGIAEIGSKLLMEKENQIYIPLGISLVLVLIGFVGIPVYALFNWLKRRKKKELERHRQPWYLWLITALVVTFGILFYLGITASIDRNPYILGFGILSSWSWIFWLVYIILGLLVYAIVKRRSVPEKNTTNFSKSLAYISWGGSLIFVCLFFYWNLLWPLSG